MNALTSGGILFALEGVLTDTAELHFEAWKWLADRLGIAFDHELNRQLGGVSRTAALGIILRHGGRSLPDYDRARLAAEKHDRYVALIRTLGPDDLLPGAADALARCRTAGLKVGLASANRNAGEILVRLGIPDAFDHIVDAAAIGRGKPAPELVLAGARGLGVAPELCIGVESSADGIAALKTAGMVAIGIGEPAPPGDADLVLPSLEGFDPAAIAGSLGHAA